MEFSDGDGDMVLIHVNSHTGLVTGWTSGLRLGIVLSFVPTVFPHFSLLAC